MTAELHFAVSQFLYQKSELCDRYDWDAYLELYDEDSEYHIPQWIDDHRYVVDPNQGLSYIYYADRSGLEDRVFRIRTGKAASATPLPRTQHSIQNLQVKSLPDGLIEARVGWSTLYNRQGLEGCFYGHATYLLRPTAEGFRIRRQHTILLNDKIDSVLDFYHV
ncbi:anthranilate 1,2-dioxygenase small subunit [Acinetobacter sp. IK40]|jgi:anthranilate 1,2-dioxygenase (deaminating, decarboxylating) small subunit|uniref:anthranilate 1,2-dioxygenase small subunit n=1 Tax=Acinetobacter sp. IK40 TaxID=2928897 RepID=UPI002D1ED6F0|nr:anthranilate 1,2-dioxygenase small subunit [Acinetobacter sp. IK40]MEB3789920.1 anthranilate 1,2-dioxygenase small subunit [Acinetobacter sp. IK40]